MRKLEDGTYMYDKDSPWDAVFGQAFFSFLFVVFAISSGFFVFQEYVDDGLPAFYYLTDAGTRHAGQAIFWMFLSRPFIKEAILKFRQTNFGGAAND